VGNNPVSAVDPSGLDIVATGPDNFKEAVADALIQIAGGGPNGKRLVNDLLYNPRITVTISPISGIRKSNTRSVDSSGKPCGSKIVIDIFGKNEEHDGVLNPPTIVLAHELGHAWLHAKFGEPLAYFDYSPTEAVHGAELGATIIENDIRSEHRAALGKNWWRSRYSHSYGPFKVPIPSGKGGGKDWGLGYRSAPLSFLERIGIW
jgi:hypothetical protein